MLLLQITGNINKLNLYKMATRKSFNVQKKTLNLIDYNSQVNYLRGKKIQILTGGGHNYGPAGTIVTLSETLGLIGGSGLNYTHITGGIPGGNNLPFTYFSVIMMETEEELKNEIKSLKEQKKDLDKEINLCLNKIEYLKETDSKTFDEDEFKAYNVLRLVDDKNLTRIAKARLIAELVKG